MKVGDGFGTTRIRSTWGEVWPGASGQLACGLPDLSGCRRPCGLRLGCGCLQLVQVHKSISFYWWQRPCDYW